MKVNFTFTNFLLTESEVFTGKSQNKTIIITVVVIVIII